MKPLLPSLKEKKRYIIFEIISEEKINTIPDREIKDAFLQLFGEIGLGNAGLIFLRNKYNNNKGVIKVNNKCVDQLKASFCMVKSIGKHKAIIKSVGVTGTLKKAQEKYLG